MKAAKDPLLYQLKVTLRDIHPPIWRRIQVPDNTTLPQLHRILQIVMGWEDCHLHEFRIDSRVYGIPDPDEPGDRALLDERRRQLREVVPQAGTVFEYVYDFGDYWQHELSVEDIVAAEPDQKYPRCLAGERSAPPEDVGGTLGYGEYLEALADPNHEEHESMLEWRGPFDPASFSLATVNRRLQRKPR